MTDNEKLALIAHTVKYCAGRCKIIAGTGTNDTAHTLQLSRVAASMGVDAVLLVTPYYNKCTQAGLIAHYTAAADTVPCPVIVYNVPSRTGVDVSVETCRALCAHPNIGGIKEASGSVPKAMRILDACAEELPLWSGNDDLTVPLMAVGARGAISVLSNVRPKLTLQMVRACQTGDYAQAGRIQTALPERYWQKDVYLSKYVGNLRVDKSVDSVNNFLRLLFQKNYGEPCALWLRHGGQHLFQNGQMRTAQGRQRHITHGYC